MIDNEEIVLLALFMFAMGVGATGLVWLAFEAYREHRPAPGPEPAWRAQPQFFDEYRLGDSVAEYPSLVAMGRHEKLTQGGHQPTGGAELVSSYEDEEGVTNIWNVPKEDEDGD